MQTCHYLIEASSPLVCQFEENTEIIKPPENVPMQAVVENDSEVGVRQEIPSGYGSEGNEGDNHDYYHDYYGDEDDDGYGDGYGREGEEGEDPYYHQHQQDLSK